MKNLDYFKYFETQREPQFDSYYAKSVVVIPKHKAEINELTINNAELIKQISAFSTLYINQKLRKNNKQIQRIVNDVIGILDSTPNVNYTAFSQFFMVYNSTYSLFKKMSVEEKQDFVYKMLEKYSKERHDMYLEYGYSDIVMQVISDSYAHKRKSVASIQKILAILSPYGFSHVKSMKKFKECSCCYFLPDKGEKKLFDNFLKEFSIMMKSREHGKRPDLVLKYKHRFYIFELKTMKGKGGGQDKQMVELDTFIKYSEKNKNVHYVTVLDAEYANALGVAKSGKLLSQKKAIQKALIKNPGNFFLNTYGINKFCANTFK